MRTNKNSDDRSNTCHLPVADFDMEKRIYVHAETGDKVNMGPFLDLFYDEVHDKEENRRQLDLEIQRALSFLETSSGYWSGSQDHWDEHHSVTGLLWRLKDVLWLIPEIPTEHPKQPTVQDIETLEKRIEELKKRLS